MKLENRKVSKNKIGIISNISSNKKLRLLVLFLVLLTLILKFITHNNQLKNEIVLSDGTKQFTFNWDKNRKDDYTDDYADWAIYYPKNYHIVETNNDSLPRLSSHLMPEGLKLVAKIKKDSCCAEIRISLFDTSKTLPMDEMVIYFLTFFKKTFKYSDYQHVGQYLYEREFVENESSKKELVRFASRGTYNGLINSGVLSFYIIEGISNKETYAQEKPEIETILKSWDNDYQNLRSKNLK